MTIHIPKEISEIICEYSSLKEIEELGKVNKTFKETSDSCIKEYKKRIEKDLQSIKDIFKYPLSINILMWVKRKRNLCMDESTFEYAVKNQPKEILELFELYFTPNYNADLFSIAMEEQTMDVLMYMKRKMKEDVDCRALEVATTRPANPQTEKIIIWLVLNTALENAQSFQNSYIYDFLRDCGNYCVDQNIMNLHQQQEELLEQDIIDPNLLLNEDYQLAVALAMSNSAIQEEMKSAYNLNVMRQADALCVYFKEENNYEKFLETRNRIKTFIERSRMSNSNNIGEDLREYISKCVREENINLRFIEELKVIEMIRERLIWMDQE